MAVDDMNEFRGCVYVSSLLTDTDTRIHCNAISWRIIHEGWGELEIEDWPEDLKEFMS
jgi:hypothetical protein